MLRNNQNYQINYLTFLQKAFMECFDYKDCEEILKEIASLDTPSIKLNLHHEELDISTIINKNGIEPSPYKKFSDISDNSKEYYKEEINLKEYIFRLNFFAQKGNQDAISIYNKIFVEVPNAKMYRDDFLIDSLSTKIKDKNLDSFSKYRNLYELFKLYKKDDNEFNYKKLADFWNDNINFWNESTEKNWADFNAYSHLESSYCKEVQKAIGSSVLLQFMAFPDKHLQFMKRMPDLIDYLDWMEIDYFAEKENNRTLYSFIEQKHIDVLSKMNWVDGKQKIIYEIFNVEDFQYGFNEKRLNQIIHLVKKNLDLTSLFNDFSPEFGQSLVNFYELQKDNKFEAKDLIAEKLAQFSLKYSLDENLPVNNVRKKKMKI